MYFIGLDWSEKEHMVCIINQDGRHLALFSIPHSPEGFARLEEEVRRLGAIPEQCLVAVETAHNLIIDFLWSRNFTVYVIPPKAVTRYRDRHRQSRSRSDKHDATTLAHILRTDRQVYRPWQPDSLLTRRLRSQVRFIYTLHQTKQCYIGQLRALLLRYYPQALTTFSDLDLPITLSFVVTYPSPQAAQALSKEQFYAFLKEHRHPQPAIWTQLYAGLQGPAWEPDPALTQIYSQRTQQMARLALEVVQARRDAIQELKTLFEQHPDREIFASLPGAGELLAPSLLAKFGDRRERYPDPAIVQALAGTCPVTEQSGKKRRILFRQACDKEFRRIMQQFAKASVPESVWAAAYWQEVRPHCDSDAHAYRCLANRWVPIIWRMWQDRKPYDEAYHLRRRAQRRQPRKT